MLTSTTGSRLRVAVLSTSRAPGLDHLLVRDPARGHRYDIVAFVATDPQNRDLGRATSTGIPTATLDIGQFYARAGARPGDLTLRRDFDRRTAGLLEGVHADLIVACGYLHVMTAPLLEAYPDRIVNVHDSDLPAYPGLHATRDAVFAGERWTRSTVHLVTESVDAGPSLIKSWAFPTHTMISEARRWGATDILKAFAYAQREWMMRAAWGPLLARAIAAFADGQVRLVGDAVHLAGAPAPLVLAPQEPAVQPAVSRHPAAAR
jgi:folate-dependent phosphoribosylglycinamide formyltransferase PurN